VPPAPAAPALGVEDGEAGGEIVGRVGLLGVVGV
jgi:hypothetical protein